MTSYPVAQLETKLEHPITLTDTPTRGLAVGAYGQVGEGLVMFEALSKTQPAMYRMVMHHSELPGVIATLQLLWQREENARLEALQGEAAIRRDREIWCALEGSPCSSDDFMRVSCMGPVVINLPILAPGDAVPEFVITAGIETCVVGWSNADSTYSHGRCRDQYPGENLVMIHCDKETRCVVCGELF